MKPEVSERLFIESLFNQSKEKLGTSSTSLQNIERLTGDASTRRYYRLFTEKYSFVVCLDNPTEEDLNPFVTVQQFLSEHNVRVPHIHDVNLQMGYILEEDLGDMTLLQYLSTVDDEEKEFLSYKKVIDGLLSLHRIKKEKINSTKIFKNSFDQKKLLDEISFSKKFFFGCFLGIKDEKLKEELVSHFEPICERLASEEMVFTHRDFHSRNIMVKDDEFITIDFQDARWYYPVYCKI